MKQKKKTEAKKKIDVPTVAGKNSLRLGCTADIAQKKRKEKRNRKKTKKTAEDFDAQLTLHIKKRGKINKYRKDKESVCVCVCISLSLTLSLSLSALARGHLCMHTHLQY